MPCQDCKHAVAELRAELDALERRHEQRQQAMHDAMSEIIDNIAAKNQTLLTSIEREVMGIFARIDAMARDALGRDVRTEKEEPPICH
jgi:hypothetical protein